MVIGLKMWLCGNWELLAEQCRYRVYTSEIMQLFRVLGGLVFDNKVLV